MRRHRTARLRALKRAALRVKTPFKPDGKRPTGISREQSSKLKFDIWAPHQPCAD
jgi:hypothetical protein